MSKELQDYISQAREAGKSDNEIRTNLSSVGWNGEQINAALKGEIPIPRPKKGGFRIPIFMSFTKTILILVLSFGSALLILSRCVFGGCPEISILVFYVLLGISLVSFLYLIARILQKVFRY